jgi:hypothetical protein
MPVLSEVEGSKPSSLGKHRKYACCFSRNGL